MKVFVTPSTLSIHLLLSQSYLVNASIRDCIQTPYKMNSLKLKPLSSESGASWTGPVLLYELPSSLSHFLVMLATSMYPQLKPDQALMFVQHCTITPKSAHLHTKDQLVMFRKIGESDETIIGILTRCEVCIDLWNVVDQGILESVETVIKTWENVHGGESKVRSGKAKAVDTAAAMMEGPRWTEMVRGGERMQWWYETLEKVRTKRHGEMLRIRGTQAPDEEV